MGLFGLPEPETLSLETLVAQLLVVRASGHLFDHQRQYPQWELAHAELQRCVAELGVGGVILLGGTAVEVGVRSQQLQSWAEIPLLLAADVEEGIGQRFAGATQFPPPMALAEIATQDHDLARHYASQMGRITAQEAVAIGLNWLLAPIVDINNNPDNPVINVRAYGETAATVSVLTQAFIQGAKALPVLTTAKHFPGHGDTAVDSHLQLPTITHPRSHLEQQELLPFRAAISVGVDAVMTAHLQIPALDPQLPATLSPAILTQLLRRDLGFDGVIITDALVMGAIINHFGPYKAAVLALEAGADVLLMPPDPKGTVQAVCEAVRLGRLTHERILASVERLWRVKQRVSDRLAYRPENCHAWEHVPPPPIQFEQLATPPTRRLAMEIVQKSQRVHGSLPPLSVGQPGQTILIVDDGLNTPWLSRSAPAIALPSQQGYRPLLWDHSGTYGKADTAHIPQHPTFLQIFCRGNPFRGSAGLNSTAQQIFQHLQSHQQLAGLAVYGSPYVLDALLALSPPELAYGFSYGIFPEAQAALLASLLQPVASHDASCDFTD